MRIPLLWDDVWAPGYDGGYYVLQVRSTLAGAPIFADRSLVFPFLAGLAALTGDVVFANKLAACLFAALTALGLAWAVRRWTGDRAAAFAAGFWVATSTLHLGISAEFLKNAAGCAVLAWVLATLPGPESGWRRWILPTGLALLGLFIHKLTGAMGVLALLAVATPAALGALGWQLPILALLAVLVVLVSGVGALRLVDLERLQALGGGAARWTVFTTRRLPLLEKIELGVVHLAPLALLAAAWRRPRWRALAPAWVLLAAIATAPGLPFSFEELSWRLLLMGFLAGAAVAGALVAACPRRLRWPLALLLALSGLAQGPGTARSQSTREPDYERFAPVLPTLQAHVPADARVVAHRGLCGFIWAAGGRVCENFQPQGDLSGWWRVAFAMSPERLAPYTGEDPAPVALLPSYTLVTETTWQRFLEGPGGRFQLARSPRNPWQPRPAFVYGPEGDTPSADDRR